MVLALNAESVPASRCDCHNVSLRTGQLSGFTCNIGRLLGWLARDPSFRWPREGAQDGGTGRFHGLRRLRTTNTVFHVQLHRSRPPVIGTAGPLAREGSSHHADQFVRAIAGQSKMALARQWCGMTPGNASFTTKFAPRNGSLPQRSSWLQAGRPAMHWVPRGTGLRCPVFARGHILPESKPLVGRIPLTGMPSQPRY